MSTKTLPRLHPLTGQSITPVGYRKDGRAIWPILGGAEDGDGNTDGQNDDTGPSGQPQWDGNVDSLPEPVQKMIRDLRKEAGDNRTAKTAAETQRQEMLDSIAKALGIKGDDTPDPAALQQTLGEREQRVNSLESDVRSKDVELAAWRSASKQGVNAVALLDSRSFLTEVAALDPKADDFATRLDAAVKTAAEANPVLRITQSPRRDPSQGARGGDAPVGEQGRAEAQRRWGAQKQ